MSDGEGRWPTINDFLDAEDNTTLDDETLMELGRLAFAVIRLEKAADYVVRCVNSQDNKRAPTAVRLGAGREVAVTWPEGDRREQTAAWMQRAIDALEMRNTVLHGDTMTFVALPGASTPQIPPNLGHQNRTTRQFTITPLTLHGLRPVTAALVHARDGWRDILMFAAGNETDASP